MRSSSNCSQQLFLCIFLLKGCLPVCRLSLITSSQRQSVPLKKSAVFPDGYLSSSLVGDQVLIYYFGTRTSKTFLFQQYGSLKVYVHVAVASFTVVDEVYERGV